jgi:hypothetical protein
VTYEAYQTFIQSKEGQKFNNLFKEDGKYGNVLVTFDISYENEIGTSGVTTPYATDKKGNNRRVYAKDDIDRGLTPDGASSSLKKGENLAFNVSAANLTFEQGKDKKILPTER